MYELSPRGRCIRCGRFIKRGLWNFIQHDAICPERQLIIFSLDPNRNVLIKNKHYERTEVLDTKNTSRM